MIYAKSLSRMLLLALCAASVSSCSSPAQAQPTERARGPWLPVRSLPAGELTARAAPAAPAIVPHSVGTNVNVSNRPSITNSKGVTMNWPQSETDLAIDPTNGQHLIGGSNDLAGNMAVYESNDGGQTWVASSMPNGITSCPSGDQCFESDPAVTFDNTGKAYFAQIAVDYPTSGNPATYLYVSNKAKGASSWATPVKISGASSPDKEFLTADLSTNKVYLVWDDNGFFGQSAHVAYTTNGGSSWTESSSSPSGSDSTTIGNYPLVGPSVVYDLYANFGSNRIRISKSTNAGSSWSTPTTVQNWSLQTGGGLGVVIPADPYRGVSAFPMAAIDMSSGAHRGRIYVAYADQGSGSNCSATFNTADPQTGAVTSTTINFETDVVLTYSDNGSTWSTPVRISNDTAGSCNDQFMPRAQVDPSDGTLYVAYYSTQNDPNRAQADFYLARSTDGGQSFTYQKVTDQPSNEGRTLCHTSSTGPNTNCSDFNGYGDYSGLAAGNGIAYPFWTDSRLSTGDEETYVAAVTPGNTPLPPSITTTSLAAATVGSAYSATVAASGGTTPYTWSQTGLPSSLSLNTSTGAITGTPVAGDVGSHSVAFTVTDAAAQTASKTLTLTVNGAGSGPTVTTTSLPTGTVGTAYTATLAATGGTTPYTWSATGLPASLTVNASTGVIGGTPASGDAGTYTVAVTVTDAASQSGSASLSLTINPSGSTLALAPQSLPNAQEGVAYSVQLTATGGTTPYSFAWSSGFTPPTGLSIASSTGVISGTPAAGTAGSVSLQVTVTDAAFATASRNYALTIDPAGSGSAPTANAGPDQTVDPGTVQLDGSASSDPLGRSLTYAWTAPANVTLSSTTNVKPTANLTAAGDYTFELVVSAGGVSSAPDSVKISVNNVAPVADAGPAQTVKAGDTVQLDGSKSHDANGDTLTFSWKQIFGTAVALSSASSPKPTFKAGADGAGYAFELTVSDGSLSSKATVTINETQAAPTTPKGGGGCGCGGGEGSVLAIAGLLAAAWRKRRAA